MTDPTPIFDPARWVDRWTRAGGRVDWHGIHWPWSIWLAPEHRTRRETDLRRMLLSLTPDRARALHQWIRDRHGYINSPSAPSTQRT